MQLPILLPENLAYCQAARNAQDLVDLLSQNSQSLLVFFQSACEDETWTELNAHLFGQLFKEVSAWFFKEQFSQEAVKQTLAILQKHNDALVDHIPLDLTVQIQQQSMKENSFLLGASSLIFFDLIREGKALIFPHFNPQHWLAVQEYIHSGEVKSLWKMPPEELTTTLETASAYAFHDLAHYTAQILKRYINKTNAIEYLLKGQEERAWELKQACIQAIANLHMGMWLEEKEPEDVAVGFQEFSTYTLLVFDQLKEYMTHLICHGSTTEEQGFTRALKETPGLRGLDISQTETYSDRLIDIPDAIQELDLSRCHWLSNQNLRNLLKQCPKLQKLNLVSNAQLTYVAWGELKKLPLKTLDLTRCYQIKDDDLAIIIQANRNILELHLDECKELTEKGFLTLARSCPNLTSLTVSKTNITDTAVTEIIFRCRYLTHLNISRCPNISDKAILALSREALNLRTLNAAHCDISQGVMDVVQQKRPLLKSVFT